MLEFTRAATGGLVLAGVIAALILTTSPVVKNSLEFKA